LQFSAKKKEVACLLHLIFIQKIPEHKPATILIQDRCTSSNINILNNKKDFIKHLKNNCCFIYSCFRCLILFQEKIFFLPGSLEKNHRFKFAQTFEEFNFKTADEKLINCLFFKADITKGLIFYLHGNEGSLARCGKYANTYTDLNYDVFFLDYKGFGKSEGKLLVKNNYLIIIKWYTMN
tara:strand:+ start:783 stop:1322 length:540 start_codon:yes stop_codon:yes gene_type:complete